DFSLLLSDPQKEEAKTKFIEEKIKYYLEKNKAKNREEARTLAEKLNPPERIYREEMSDQEGLIVVYLMDINSIFRIGDKDQTEAMNNLYLQKGYAKISKVPLVGIAIGFPKIIPDPGGEYVKGDYEESEDLGDEDDPDGVIHHSETL